MAGAFLDILSSRSRRKCSKCMMLSFCLFIKMADRNSSGQAQLLFPKKVLAETKRMNILRVC
jgi:hypothetical protein